MAAISTVLLHTERFAGVMEAICIYIGIRDKPLRPLDPPYQPLEWFVSRLPPLLWAYHYSLVQQSGQTSTHTWGGIFATGHIDDIFAKQFQTSWERKKKEREISIILLFKTDILCFFAKSCHENCTSTDAERAAKSCVAIRNYVQLLLRILDVY